MTCDIPSRKSFAIILGNLILIYFAHADSKSLFTQCCVRRARTSVATLALESEQVLRVENQFVIKPQETWGTLTSNSLHSDSLKPCLDTNNTMLCKSDSETSAKHNLSFE